jgi:hemerythrin
MVFWTKLTSNRDFLFVFEMHPYVEDYLIQHIDKFDHTITRYIKDIVEEKQ